MDRVRIRVQLEKSLFIKINKDNSKKAFTERIITNINFKKWFKARHKPYVDGKQVERNKVLMGWKVIQKEHIEPEDIEDDNLFLLRL